MRSLKRTEQREASYSHYVVDCASTAHRPESADNFVRIVSRNSGHTLKIPNDLRCHYFGHRCVELSTTHKPELSTEHRTQP